MALVAQDGWKDVYCEIFSGSAVLPHGTSGERGGGCSPRGTVPGPDLHIPWRHLTVFLSFSGTIQNQSHLDVSSLLN